MPDISSSSSSLGATPHPPSLIERSERPARTERAARTERPARTEGPPRSERSSAVAVIVAMASVVPVGVAGAAATSRVSDVVVSHRRLLVLWAPRWNPTADKYQRHSKECQRHIVRSLRPVTPVTRATGGGRRVSTQGTHRWARALHWYE